MATNSGAGNSQAGDDAADKGAGEKKVSRAKKAPEAGAAAAKSTTRRTATAKSTSVKAAASAAGDVPAKASSAKSGAGSSGAGSSGAGKPAGDGGPVKTSLRDGSGADKGTVELPGDLFGARIHRHAMWLAVRGFLINQRQGTSKVKNRKEVSGGGIKPWRQKGTGRARSGTIRSPIWVGGARAFGPKPRDYHIELPKKLRRVAFVSALSVRAKEGNVTVLTDAGATNGKTKELFSLLRQLGFADRRCLLIVDQSEQMAVRAGRNLPFLDTTNAGQVNTYEVMRAEQILVTSKALEALKEVRAK